jgi:hypothetical protein
VFSLNCLRGSSLLFTPSRPVCLFGEKQRALRAAHFKNLPSVVYLRTTQIADRSKHWPVLPPFFQKIKKNYRESGFRLHSWDQSVVVPFDWQDSSHKLSLKTDMANEAARNHKLRCLI